MRLQIIQDSYGQNTGVFIPINDWLNIIQKYQDLKSLVNIEPEHKTKTKLSQFAGKISNETAEAMQKYSLESRDDWDERLRKQL